MIGHAPGTAMSLDTYQSAALPEVFATLPSSEAPATIAIVDKLAALRLQLVRGGYALRSGPHNEAFVEFVTTRIGAVGYAIHGFDVGFEQRAQPRSAPPREAFGVRGPAKRGRQRPRARASPAPADQSFCSLS